MGREGRTDRIDRCLGKANKTGKSADWEYIDDGLSLPREFPLLVLVALF